MKTSEIHNATLTGKIDLPAPIKWMTLEELSELTGLSPEEIEKQFDRAPDLLQSLKKK